MVSRRKPVTSTETALQRQRYRFILSVLFTSTICLSLFLYVIAHIYLMVTSDHPSNTDISKDIFSSFLSTLKLIIGAGA